MGKPINEYPNDSKVTLNDKVVGTDSDGNRTSNYPIKEILALQDTRYAPIFLAYKYAAATSNYDSTVSGYFTADSDDLSLITELKLNKKNNEGQDVTDYLRSIGTQIVGADFDLDIKSTNTTTDYVKFTIKTVTEELSFFTITGVVVVGSSNGSFVDEDDYLLPDTKTVSIEGAQGDMQKDEFVNPGGTGQVLDSKHADDSDTVNSLTVETAVPAGALFTDTIYDDSWVQPAIDDVIYDDSWIQPSIDERVRFKGYWVNASYKKNDMVYTGPWMGVAKVDTSDIFPPYQEGSPNWLLTSDPLWEDLSSVGDVYVAIQFYGVQFNTVDSFRVWSNGVATEEYSIYAYEVSETGSTTFLDFHDLGSGLDEGWHVVSLDQFGILQPNQKYRLVVQIHGATNTSSLADDWVYEAGQSDPAAGDISQTVDGFHVNQVSDNATDQSTFLAGLGADDTILMAESGDTSRYSAYRIVAALPKVGNVYNYSTILIAQGREVRDGNDVTVTFENRGVPVSTSYNRIVDNWPIPDTLPDQIQGFVTQDPDVATSPTPGLNNNAYGVDLFYDTYVISPDWTYIAIGEGASNSGTPSDTIQIIDDLITQDSTKALSANMGYVLDQKIIDAVNNAVTVADDLVTQDATVALSANQGYVLDQKVQERVLATEDTEFSGELRSSGNTLVPWESDLVANYQFLRDGYEPLTFEGEAGETLANGDIVYQSTEAGVWLKASASTEAQVKARLAYVVTGASTGQPVELSSQIIHSTGTYALGDTVYLSETAGQLTVTVPTTGFVRVVGSVISTSSIYFNGESLNYVTADGDIVNGVRVSSGVPLFTNVISVQGDYTTASRDADNKATLDVTGGGAITLDETNLTVGWEQQAVNTGTENFTLDNGGDIVSVPPGYFAYYILVKYGVWSVAVAETQDGGGGPETDPVWSAEEYNVPRLDEANVFSTDQTVTGSVFFGEGSSIGADATNLQLNAPTNKNILLSTSGTGQINFQTIVGLGGYFDLGGVFHTNYGAIISGDLRVDTDPSQDSEVGNRGFNDGRYARPAQDTEFTAKLTVTGNDDAPWERSLVVNAGYVYDNYVPITESGTAGESLSAGNIVYKDTESNHTWYKASASVLSHVTSRLGVVIVAADVGGTVGVGRYATMLGGTHTPDVPLYLSTTAGATTEVPPTGNNYVRVVGTVLESNARYLNVKTISWVKGDGTLVNGVDLSVDHPDNSDFAMAPTTGPKIISHLSTDTYGHLLTASTRDLSLSDMSDVSQVSPASSEVLARNSSNTRWENRTLAELGAVAYTHPNHYGQVTSNADRETALTVSAITAQTNGTVLDGTDEIIYNDGGVLKKLDLNYLIKGFSDIGANITGTDELMISDNGTIKRTDVSRLITYLGGSFLRKNTADSKITGDLTMNDNIGLVLGSGTDTRLYYDAAKTRTSITLNTGDLHIFDGITQRFKFERTTGYFSAVKSFATSSRDLKENIETWTEPALDIINSIEVVSYDFKDGSGTNNIGAIAEDVPEQIAAEDRKSIDIYTTVFIQAKAIQELSKKNEDLEARLERLERIIQNRL